MSNFEFSKISDSKGEITFHGVPYQDFDRTRYWSFWGIAKMFECARVMLLGMTGVARDLFTPTSGVFLVKQVIHMDPKVQRKTVYLTQFVPKFVFELQQIGTTSVSHVTKMYNEKTGEFCGECFIKMVHVDRRSRQPCPLPEQMRKLYSKFCDREELPMLSKTDIGAVPDDAYKYSIKVLHSDMDTNGHTNQSIYVKYCVDCATDAALNGFYRHFKSDMCLHPVRQASLQYIGESRSNMILTVNTWQNEQDVSKIYFIIAREDGKHILQATFHFDKTESKRMQFPKL